MSDADPPFAGSSTRVDYVALAPGQRVGRYEILGVLGQGGFGITYRARDTQLDRKVALKEYLPVALAVRQDGASVLPRSTGAADDFNWGRDRFIEEGRTLATLHEAPSIVKVFDFLEENGTAYIVMEMLRGETLEARIKAEGPFTAGEVDSLMWPLLEGLQQVHEAGFLHRDIKPANVFIGAEGKPTLIDFGASRAAMVGRTVDLTAIFTPGYAAPEQFTSAKQGPWTDIYGLAATLYHAITGNAPPGAFDRLMEDRYEPLVRRQPPGFARSLMIGIDAGLSLQANARPQTISGWRALLGQASPVSEATVVMMPPPMRSATPAPRAEVAVVPRRGDAGRWIALGAALMLVLAGGGYYAFAPSPQPSAVVAADGDTKRALQEAEAGRLKAKAEIDKLKADTARREFEVAAADKKRLEQAAARQQMEADAEAKRKAEEQQKTAEDEAKARAIRLPSPAVDDVYRGSLTESTKGHSVGIQIMAATLRLAGTSISGQIDYPRCGPSSLVLAVSPSGEISGAIRLPEAMACAPVNVTAGGRVSDSVIQLELRGVGTIARGTLVRGRDRSAAVAPAVPAASPQPTPAPVPAAAATNFNGIYAGSLSTSTPGGSQAGMRPLAAELQISGNRLTGQLVHATCGATPISLAIEASGVIAGGMRFYEPIGCSLNDASATGKVSVNALTLDIRGVNMSARGSLPRRAD
jgi:serine/threonine protein kinase